MSFAALVFLYRSSNKLIRSLESIDISSKLPARELIDGRQMREVEFAGTNTDGRSTATFENRDNTHRAPPLITAAIEGDT